MARSTTKRLSATQLAPVLRDVITRFNRRLRQARPVGELTITQLSALTSLELAGALTPRELADAERVQPPRMARRCTGRARSCGGWDESERRQGQARRHLPVATRAQLSAVRHGQPVAVDRHLDDVRRPGLAGAAALR